MSFKYAVIDIETTGLNRFKDKINYIGIGLAETLTQKKFSKTYLLNLHENKDLSKFLKIVSKLRASKIELIWQGGKFDTLFIEKAFGVLLPIHHDTMLLGTAYDLSASHALDDMAIRYCKFKPWDIPLREKTKPNNPIVEAYLEVDLEAPWELFKYFKLNMTKEQTKVYLKLLKPAYLTYREVERKGIYVDQKKLKGVQKKYAQEEKERLAELNKKYSINWNSAPQIQKVLFEVENLPIVKKSEKTGKPSAGADVLKRLASKGYDLPKEILEYKKSNTLNKMFLGRWNEDIGDDGRIHPSFGLTNVVTGRTSCSNPNLQQVPRTKDVRAVFTAPKGKKFFEADYSQLELRIAAHYANEPTMLKIYRENGDIHTETAKTLTGNREMTKEDRSKAKAINFGFLYGMSAKGFVEYAFNSYGVNFSLQEARVYRELFFAKYSGLEEWHKYQAQVCETLGGVYNLFGRFRALPDIYHSNGMYRSAAVRRAINTPVQGTGSDLLLASAIEINKTLKAHGVSVVGTVHDSILGEFNEEDEDWAVEEIKRIMSKPKLMSVFGVKLSVELVVDIGIGAWGEK